MIEHGGNVEKVARQLGLNPQQLIDFSANINPLGIPVSLKQQIADLLEMAQYYPDIAYTLPREHIATYEKVNVENVLLSNGAAQAFFELAQALKPKHLLILAPTFSEYRQAFSQVGAQILEYRLCAEQQYKWTFSDLAPTLEQLVAQDVVVICQPNNPTGTLVEREELIKLAEILQNKQMYLIIDEAFMDFVVPKEQYSFVPYLHHYPNVIVTKSLTKFFAVPGLRLGYALSGAVDFIQTIMQTRVPWSVNSLAAMAIPILLSDTLYHQQTQQWLSVEKDWLYTQLTQLPHCQVVYPSVNYIFFECDAPIDLVQKLLTQGIMIRSCKNYSYLSAKHYRVAVKTREHNQLLINALKSILIGETYA